MRRTGRAALLVAALLALVLVAGCGPAAGGGPGRGNPQVRVAAASDLRFALPEVLDRFAQDHPEVPVVVSYGSSGNFATQLAQGAPFDVFLSADAAYPEQLREAGLTRPGSQFTYAFGRLAVWAEQDRGFDLAGGGLAALADEQIRSVAVANPEHAPYGVAAVAALAAAGLAEQVEPKLVFGDNVAQAAQFATSGAADAAIVALALALAPQLAETGDWAEVPADLFPAMRQDGVIMQGAEDAAAAETFTAYLAGAPGRDVLRQYGFGLPDEE